MARAVDPCARNSGEAIDFFVLVPLFVDQEVEGVFVAADAGGEGAAALVFTIPSGEHADVDFFGEFPDTVGHFGRGFVVVVVFLDHAALLRV